MKRKKKSEKPDFTFDWPFKISVDLDGGAKSRVAFMSSQSRTYFPEDPGVSRFGIYYSMNCAPGEVPNPKYYPSENRLQKPVSTKGYGIGGLSGSRYAKVHLEHSPGPTQYQPELNVPIPLKKKKSEAKPKKTIIDETKRPFVTPQMIAQQKALMIKRCLQSKISFGSMLSLNRFGIEPRFKCVGVGYYDLRQPEAQLAKFNSFGQGPVKVVPPVQIRCDFKNHDRCFICDTEMRTVDYYRSRMRVPNPVQAAEIAKAKAAKARANSLRLKALLEAEAEALRAKANSLRAGSQDLRKKSDGTEIPTNSEGNEMPKKSAEGNQIQNMSAEVNQMQKKSIQGDQIPKKSLQGNQMPKKSGDRNEIQVNFEEVNDDEEEPIEEEKVKLLFVNLCRKCYCRGMRGELKYWNRSDISFLFHKARHCSFIHEHHDIPEFTNKTSCTLLKKIQRKEALMAKYYDDQCERVLKQK